jgi:hypothetical protein
MARTQYIFIDYENVCESDLSRVSGKPVRVFMILGTHHKKLPTSLFLFAQDHPEQVRMIQTPVVGRNALDFVLTLELGRMIAADPAGYFHIVSKDTDFDSVIRHLKTETKLIARHASLAEIPALRTTEERIAGSRTNSRTKPNPARARARPSKTKSSPPSKTKPSRNSSKRPSSPSSKPASSTSPKPTGSSTKSPDFFGILLLSSEEIVDRRRSPQKIVAACL